MRLVGIVAGLGLSTCLSSGVGPPLPMGAQGAPVASHLLEIGCPQPSTFAETVDKVCGRTAPCPISCWLEAGTSAVAVKCGQITCP